MKGTVDTSYGTIQIDNTVVAQYAGTVATHCPGIVGMTTVNVKDGLVRLLKKDSVEHGIVVKTSGNKLILDFHVIVVYGANIPAIIESLYSDVKNKVETFTGLEIEKINVYIEGVRVID